MIFLSACDMHAYPRAQNLLARVVTSSLQPSSYTLPQQLHWLPTEHRINIKTANITFCTLHPSQPAHLYSAFHAHHLVPSGSQMPICFVPFVCTSFAARSFSIAAPTFWNSLPPALRMCTSPDIFVAISRLTISRGPFNLLNAFFLRLRLGFY